MKTLYLHIGTPKTMTTAIQGFCTDNYDVLSSKGYAYPSFPYRYPNVGERRNAHFLIDYKPTTAQPTDFEKSDEVWKEAFAKIYELWENHDNIILSDEAIWNFGCRMDYRVWKKLKAESEAGNFTVKVIVYFRRQDEFMFSWWNQQVKEGMHGNSVLNWAEMAEKKAYIQLDYYGILENIASYVGKENIMVRLFDRSKFFGGTIYADFMHCIGLEFTDEYEIKAEVRNISLTKNNIEIKRMLNSLPGLDNKSNVMFRKVLSGAFLHIIQRIRRPICFLQRNWQNLWHNMKMETKRSQRNIWTEFLCFLWTRQMKNGHQKMKR